MTPSVVLAGIAIVIVSLSIFAYKNKKKENR